MSIISKVWNFIRSSPAVLYPAFSIPPDRVVSPQIPAMEFNAHKAYFELRICEQFLRDKRKYWEQYNPLTLLCSEFIYAGAKQSFPFVVGPSLLKGLPYLEEGDRVRYRNTRVVGPVPYRGDDVAIFVGLFRVKTGDWARQALSLLESVAKVFDSSKLSNYLNITEPLMDGIESFLGMGDQMQLRLGQRNAFTDPETHHVNVFSPGYFVMIRVDQQKIKKENFAVKDGQLYVGQNVSQLRPYMEQDYILYRVACLDKRSDYTTFDFHRQWEDVQDQIWRGNEKSASKGRQHLMALIFRSPDLIPSQINQLGAFYDAMFTKQSAEYRSTREPTISIAEFGASRFNKSLERMSHINVEEEAIGAITKIRDYFLEEASIRPQISGPTPLTEEDIQAALDSQILNDPSVNLIEPDKLSDALSLEMPIV